MNLAKRELCQIIGEELRARNFPVRNALVTPVASGTTFASFVVELLQRGKRAEFRELVSPAESLRLKEDGGHCPIRTDDLSGVNRTL